MKTDFKTINYRTYKTSGGKQSQPDSRRLTRIVGVLLIINTLIIYVLPNILQLSPAGFLVSLGTLFMLYAYMKLKGRPSTADSIFDIPNAESHFAPGYLDCGAIYSSLVDSGNSIDDMFSDSSGNDLFSDSWT